ncbi:hypothetical protein Daesc_007140 [Daldinia eschscholtzii]|uniref:Uncharacterized protein n=1 Tax=Daldinia eschscholtzii TaxID=292717 RepID=A0AAX6MDW4_9PEZI
MGLLSGSSEAPPISAQANDISTILTQQDERHSYEKCQYDEFKKRVARMNELREAKGGARSN